VPIGFSDHQFRELRLAAGSLPVESRAEIVRLVLGFLELEGSGTTDGAFSRATRFALDACIARSCAGC
jgi:hypothetical protein